MKSETSISLAEALAECDGQMHQAAAPSFVTDLLKDGQRLRATALLGGARKAIKPRWWQSAEVSFETNSAVFPIKRRKLRATEIALDSEAWSRELANVTLQGFRDLRLEHDPAVQQKQQTELARHLASSTATVPGPEQADGKFVSLAAMAKESLLPWQVVRGWLKHKKLAICVSIEGEIRGDANPPIPLFWTSPQARRALITSVVPTKYLDCESGIAMVSREEFDLLVAQDRQSVTTSGVSETERIAEAKKADDSICDGKDRQETEVNPKETGSKVADFGHKPPITLQILTEHFVAIRDDAKEDLTKIPSQAKSYNHLVENYPKNQVSRGAVIAAHRDVFGRLPRGKRKRNRIAPQN